MARVCFIEGLVLRHQELELPPRRYPLVQELLSSSGRCLGPPTSPPQPNESRLCRGMLYGQYGISSRRLSNTLSTLTPRLHHHQHHPLRPFLFSVGEIIIWPFRPVVTLPLDTGRTLTSSCCWILVLRRAAFSTLVWNPCSLVTTDDLLDRVDEQ